MGCQDVKMSCAPNGGDQRDAVAPHYSDPAASLKRGRFASVLVTLASYRDAADAKRCNWDQRKER
jgi:hypothetical protein